MFRFAVKTTLFAASLALAGMAAAQDKVDGPAMEKLAKDKNCMTCHSATKKLVGPSYLAIADHYRGKKDAEAKVVDKVLKGGSGTFGPIPMPPNGNVTKDEAEKLVRWILQTK
jgi:cytochrome c